MYIESIIRTTKRKFGISSVSRWEHFSNKQRLLPSIEELSSRIFVNNGASLIDGRRLKEDDIGGERIRVKELKCSLNESTLEQWELTTNDSQDSSALIKSWRGGGGRRGEEEVKDARFAHGFHFARSWLTERWNLILRDVMSREKGIN